ncbi:hypothetical protein [Arenimonas composti]|uniref:hypothetical protein n=1 Tax=Arenimonas composti TaxID=370776 RepID=UPI0012B5202F|nr:hypothetical protein [Arenimonas composti]
MQSCVGGDCFAHAANYWRFLALLRRAAEAEGCAIHAYVLLPDGFELLLSADDTRAAGRLLARAGAGYVPHFNASTGRRGRLWRGARTTPVRGAAALATCREAIEQAPVRAGLVEAAARWRWSSYRHHALGIDDPLVSSVAAVPGQRAGRSNHGSELKKEGEAPC